MSKVPILAIPKDVDKYIKDFVKSTGSVAVDNSSSVKDELYKNWNLFLAVPMEKSFVEAHYRHDSKGKLVFVQAYHNKKYAKPEELQASHITTQQINAQPIDDINQKLISFHKGDEVLVKYSHMHDQHFLLGAVLSIRDDKSHSGKLIAVRLLDGRIEYYRPNSLVHIHKEGAEHRTHEKSHYTDDNNVPIEYKHLNPEQKQFFYDQYKLWFRLHRMGELKAFNDNKNLFKLDDGSYPSHKDDLSAEQKIQLEKLNKFPIVPLDAIREMVSDEGYNKGKHSAIAKQLLSDIETMEKQGIPSVAFPKLYKKKGKKENAYAPPEWMSGMFPSVEEEFDGTKEDYDKVLEDIHKKLGSLTPSVNGPVYGNNKDFHYGQPLTHGQVIQPKEEGSVYKPAPKLPDAKLSTSAAFFKEIAKEAELPSSKPKEEKKIVDEDKKEPNPIVPIENKDKEEIIEKLFKEKDDISDLNFNVVGNASDEGFGGTHSKYILSDEYGNKYLFKPYKDSEVYRSWVDIIAHKVAKATGLQTAEFGSKPITIKLPSGIGGSYSGKKCVGSVQKVITGLQTNNISHFVKNDFSNTPKKNIEQLQREHVIDWLLGNNDAHAAQFIIKNDGDIVGVDKGHCFKYYKDDVLSLDYDPAGNNNIGNPSVYHKLLKAAKSNVIKLDFSVVKNFINHDLKNLSHTDFANMIIPYAENSVLWSGNAKGLQELALKRLNNISNDFEKLYKSCGIETGTNEVSVEPENLTEFGHQPDAFQQIDSHFHTKVMNAKAIGCSILMGGGHIEDMSVLFTPYEWKFDSPNPDHSGKGMEVSFKLMEGHEQDVLSKFDTVEDSDTQYVPSHGTLEHTFDPLGQASIAAAKTVNHHCIASGGDGKINPDTMNMFAKHFQGLDKFDKNAPILSVDVIANNLSSKFIKPEFFDDHVSLSYDMAEHYHKIASDVIEAVQNEQKTKNKLYQAWSGKYTSKSNNVSKSKNPHATYPEFTMDSDGNLIRKPGDKMAVYKQGVVEKYGTVFKKQLDGNITVSYYPHYSKDLHGQNNLRSQQGYFSIDFHNWDGNIQSMHKTREVLKKFGIDHKLSTPADIECLYLTRIAWQNKANIEHESEFEKIAKMENNEKKIQALKALCEKSYGASPDTLSTYHPIPKWDDNSGHHYFLNPYVLSHLQSNPKVKHYLKHDLQASSSGESIENVARFGLLSIERRRHLGFNYFGMSTQSDQISGGGNYVFFRGMAPQNDDPFKLQKGSLIFRPELWARTDLIPRLSDCYGTTHNKISNHGKIHDRSKIMDVMNAGKDVSFNDTTVKNNVSMSNWLMGMAGEDNESDDYNGTKKYNNYWNKFKKYILKHKPHVMNHAQFPGVK